MLGSNLSGSPVNRVFYNQTGLPEKYQDAFRHGVHFFELHFPKPQEFNKPIYGPWDIKVEAELIEGTFKTRYREIYFTGQSAHIRYEKVDKTGLAIAFMFDDKYWHNRVMLIDNPIFRVHQMHTRDGIIPGSAIRLDIECLRDVITEETPIFKVMNSSDRELTFFYKKTDAEKYLSRLKDDSCYIEDGKKRQKTKKVLSLIAKYKDRQFGWTDCPEFNNEIRPQVEELIVKKRESLVLEGQIGGNAPSPADIKAQVFSVLKSLPKEELLAFVKAAADQPQQVDTTPRFSKTALKAKKSEELAGLAKAFDIDVEGKKKDDIIDEIINRQTEMLKLEEQKVPDEQEITVT